MGTLYLFNFSVNIKLVLNIESINKNKQTKNNENLHQGVLGYEQDVVTYLQGQTGLHSVVSAWATREPVVEL